MEGALWICGCWTGPLARKRMEAQVVLLLPPLACNVTQHSFMLESRCCVQLRHPQHLSRGVAIDELTAV